MMTLRKLLRKSINPLPPNFKKSNSYTIFYHLFIIHQIPVPRETNKIHPIPKKRKGLNYVR